MTPEQARELERRLRARGLSRKAAREALTAFRAWLAEQPAGGASEAEADDVAIAAALAVAESLLRDLQRR